MSIEPKPVKVPKKRSISSPTIQERVERDIKIDKIMRNIISQCGENTIEMSDDGYIYMRTPNNEYTFPLGMASWWGEKSDEISEAISELTNNVYEVGSSMAAIYAREYIEKGTMPPSVYYEEVLEYLQFHGCDKEAHDLAITILAECYRADKEKENPLKKVKIARPTYNEPKLDILRADLLKEHIARANRMRWFKRMFTRLGYRIATWATRKKIDYAIRRHKNCIYLHTNDWSLKHYPELLDRLEYLGYEVSNKGSFFSDSFTWENKYKISWTL